MIFVKKYLGVNHVVVYKKIYVEKCFLTSCRDLKKICFIIL